MNKLAEEVITVYKDALQSIFGLLSRDWKACSMAFCLASAQFDEEVPGFRVLELSPRLTERIRNEVIISVLTEYQKQWHSRNLALHIYDSGSKPSDDEIECLNLAMPEFASIKRQIKPLESLLDMGTFQEDEKQFVSGLRFYAISIHFHGDPEPVYFFRSYTSKNLLSKSRFLAAMWRGQDEYDSIEAPILLFDKHIDCISRGDVMFVLKKENFHYIFRYLEEVMRAAKLTLSIIEARVPIKNFEKFALHCEKHPLKMAKLKNISQKPYLKDLTIDRIKKVIDRMNREQLGEAFIRTLEEEKMLLYDGRKPWMLLKLLDDDYLWSEMTELGYEVDGKRELG